MNPGGCFIFLKMTIVEGRFDIKLIHFHPFWAANAKIALTLSCLETGAKVSLSSTQYCCVYPFTTHLALYFWIEPSGLNFLLKPISPQWHPCEQVFPLTPMYYYSQSFFFLPEYHFLHSSEFRSRLCVFIGDGPNYKGYLLVLIYSRERVYTSRHVIFNEESFPYSNVFSLTSNSSSSNEKRISPIVLINSPPQFTSQISFLPHTTWLLTYL